MEMIGLVVTLIASVFGSTGLWSIVLHKIQKRDQNKSATTRLLLGLGYREIIKSCIECVQRGSITKDEYEDLNKYLYQPYTELGGDGTAERLIEEIRKLPITEGSVHGAR